MQEESNGWREDPFGRFQYRWHDGVQWTGHVANGTSAGFDPSSQATPPYLAAPPKPTGPNDFGDGTPVHRSSGGKWILIVYLVLVGIATLDGFRSFFQAIFLYGVLSVVAWLILRLVGSKKPDKSATRTELSPTAVPDPGAGGADIKTHPSHLPPPTTVIENQGNTASARRGADSEEIMRQAAEEFRTAWKSEDITTSSAALQRASSELQVLTESSEARAEVRLEAQLLMACTQVLQARALPTESFDQVHRGWWQLAKHGDEQDRSAEFLWHAARAMEEATWAALLVGEMDLARNWADKTLFHYRFAGVSDRDAAAVQYRFLMAMNEWVFLGSGWFHHQPERPHIILGSDEAQEIYSRHAALKGRPGPPVERNEEAVQLLAAAPAQFVPPGVARLGFPRTTF